MQGNMKKLYTSYYARNGKHPQAISISAARPRWYPNIGHMPELAPDWELVKAYKSGEINVNGYIERFWQLIAERDLDPFEVVKQIPDGSVLLCYEKPTDFCHRHLVAEWLNMTGEAEVIELPIEPKAKGLFD